MKVTIKDIKKQFEKKSKEDEKHTEKKEEEKKKVVEKKIKEHKKEIKKSRKEKLEEHRKAIKSLLVMAGLENFDEQKIIKRFYDIIIVLIFAATTYYFYEMLTDLGTIQTLFAPLVSLIFSSSFFILFLIVLIGAFVILDKVFVYLKKDVNDFFQINSLTIYISDSLNKFISNFKRLTAGKKRFILASYAVLLLIFMVMAFVLYRSFLMGNIVFVKLIFFMFSLWTLVFVLLYFALWAIFYFMVDLKIYRRRVDMELVLPDFLQLVALNIKSGMPIDKALWFSARPGFGVLAKEIETVAKKTITGTELDDAIVELTKKFDSLLLKRSMSLLIEGMNAGGEVAGLLNKIAANIQETQIMKREMGASVTSYVIFITFASIIMAPFLMGLAYQLLQIIQQIMGGISIPDTTDFSFKFNANSLKLEDFKVFAMITLAIGAFFSACITSTIKKGNIKEGLRSLPMYVIVSLVTFLIAITILDKFLGNLI